MAAPTPTRIIDRSYLIHEKLGEGSMGIVSRATQLVSGQNVALKLIKLASARGQKTPQPRTTVETMLRLALAREFQTLASLHHPNVIRVLSYGFDDELASYFTMELLEAPKTLLQSAAGLPLPDKILLLGQLFRALIYIHQRGILHRDIKPSNVLVVNGEVKVLDFGIAVLAADSSDLAGTLAYMAPELLLRKAATAASDLYSAGVLMHEVLTGTFPYSQASLDNMLADILGDDSEQTLAPTVASLLDSYRNGWTARQRSDGSAPSDEEHTSRASGDLAETRTLELSTELPAELAQIVRKLLERRPEDRYKDASSVLQDLAAAVQFPLPLETAATRDSFLQSTELVGREAELTQLKTALEQARGGTSSGCLIGGESGIGKSRLLSELRTQALVRGFWVAEGQSVTEGGEFYQEWLPLLRALCFRAELLDEEASVFKDVLPDIGELLGKEVADPPKVKAEEMQTRLGSTLITVLGKVSKPLLLVLEDLQWGRKESLSLLGQVAKATQQSALKLLLVVAHRTDESPELPQKLKELQSIVLKRLDTGSITRLSERMLGEVGKKPDLIEYLQRQTEGNVFFLIEIVRALAEDAGELRRIGEGLLPETVLTVGIERIVERRLEHVAPSYLPVLEFAAAMGRRLYPEVLECAFPNLALRTFLDECANCTILETQGADWRFAHDKLREAILRRIAPQRRCSLHRQIGEALEALYRGAERDSRNAQLAFHFAHGERPDRAFLYYAQAGEQATRLGLLTEARGHYRDALTALGSLPTSAQQQRQRLDLLLKLLHCSMAFDAFDSQLELIQQAQGILDSMRDTKDFLPADRTLQILQMRIDYQHGRACYYAARPTEALRLYQRVLPVAQECGELELFAIPAAAIGMALCSQGHMRRGYSHINRAADPLRQLGNFFEEARTRIYMGLARSMMGMYHEGIRELQQQVARAQEIKQAQLAPMAQIMLSLAQRGAMDWPALLETIAGAGAVAAKLGERTFAILPWSAEAWALTHLGRHTEGAELRSKALALASEVGGKYIVADWFIAGDAEMALLRGNAESALEIARTLIQTARAAELVLSWGIAERVWALALGRLGGRLDEAEEHLRESLRVLALGELRLDMGQTELGWGRLLRERGDAAGAQPHFATALSIFDAAGCDYAVAQVRKSMQ